MGAKGGLRERAISGAEKHRRVSRPLWLDRLPSQQQAELVELWQAYLDGDTELRQAYSSKLQLCRWIAEAMQLDLKSETIQKALDERCR